MAETTLSEQRIEELYLEADEAKKFNGSFCQILNQFYSEVELVKPMPGQILKGAIALHETFFSANKLNILEIEEISQKADLRKSAFLRKQEEEIKENERKESEAEDTISEIVEKDIDLEEHPSTPQSSADTLPPVDEKLVEETTNSKLEILTQFLADKSPAFRLTSLHFILTLDAWKNMHPQIQEIFETARQAQQKKINLFEKIIDNNEQGLTLAESLQQEEFGELIEECTALAQKMDESEMQDESLFLKHFLHRFKSEPKRNYEMLTLVIAMKYCKNEKVIQFLKKLYSKWPQKNEQKDKRVILEMTKRHLKIV